MKKELAHNISKNIAARSATGANLVTGWKKWILVAVATVAGAIAWFTQQTESAPVTPVSPPDTQAPAP